MNIDILKFMSEMGACLLYKDKRLIIAGGTILIPKFYVEQDMGEDWEILKDVYIGYSLQEALEILAK